MPDLQRVFEYHGAEHKTISCYKAGGTLTPENAQRSRASIPRCGTSFLLLVMIVAIVVFAPLGKLDWHWLFISRIVGIPIVAGLAFELIKWFGKNRTKRWARVLMWPGIQLQRLTTREPDLSQLAVAIAALEAVLAVENPRAAADEEKVGMESSPRFHPLPSGKAVVMGAVLLTGATGFVGTELLRRLFERDDHRVHALVRAADDEAAAERLPAHARLNAVAGDIEQPGLGLSGARATGSRRTFDGGPLRRLGLVRPRPGESRRVNVEGTRNVVEFAERCRRLERLTYVSTAYVAGEPRGLFSEDQLDVGQSSATPTSSRSSRPSG